VLSALAGGDELMANREPNAADNRETRTPRRARPLSTTRWALIPGLVITVAAAACSNAEEAARGSTPIEVDAISASPVSSGAAIDEGWTEVVVEDQGISLALPDTWETLSTQDLEDSGALEARKQEHPEESELLDLAAEALESGAMSLLAYDPDSPGAQAGFATNLNVVHAPSTSTDDPDQIAAQLAQAAGQIPDMLGEPETGSVNLPSGEAGLVRYHRSVAGESGAVDVLVTQYGIPADGEGFILTFSTLAEDAAGQEDTFEAIAETFRLGE
jgi:hypothetical protein